MKEKQELKKQLIVLSVVLVLVIILAIVLNLKDRNTESYTKIKDSTDIIELDTGEIVLYSEEEQDIIDNAEE